MRRRSLIAALLLLAGLLCYQAARNLTIHLTAHAAVTARPFTAQFWAYDASNRLIEERTIARRSDGSQATVFAFAAEGRAARQILWMDGAVLMLADWLQAKMSAYAKPERIAAYKEALLNPPPHCAAPYETYLGDETRSGVTLAVVRRSSAPNGAGAVEKEWRAPDYGCVTLMSAELDPQPDGTSLTRSHEDLKFFQPGEPDPRLFAPGAAYREMRPSQLRRAALIADGLTEQNCPRCFQSNFNAAADAAYLAGQKAN